MKTLTELQESIAANPEFEVLVFSKPDCFGCKKTIELLTTAGVPFKYIDVFHVDAEAGIDNTVYQDQLREASLMQMPVVVNNTIDTWTGLRPGNINKVIEAWKALNSDAEAELISA